MVNPIQRVKPGASTLLVGVAQDGTRYVAMAHQRYGRGKVIAFPVQDSWIWQMHASIPLEDQTHETLWRQLLRWLVSYVSDPVTAMAAPDAVEPGQSVRLTADVRDSAYLGLNGAEVERRRGGPFRPDGHDVRSPGRSIPTANITATSLRPKPATTGSGSPRRTAPARWARRRRSSGWLRFRPNTSAPACGPPSSGASPARREAGSISRPTCPTWLMTCSTPQSGAVVRDRRDLWDMPAIFLLLVGVMGGEWLYRRRRGLA